MFDLNHPLPLVPKTLREFSIINHFFLTNAESFDKKYPLFFNGPPVDLTAKVPTPSWWPFIHLRHLPHLSAPAATDKETLNEATACDQGFACLAGDSCVPRCQLESQGSVVSSWYRTNGSFLCPYFTAIQRVILRPSFGGSRTSPCRRHQSC
jgi:hypothetical protein